MTEKKGWEKSLKRKGEKTQEKEKAYSAKRHASRPNVFRVHVHCHQHCEHNVAANEHSSRPNIFNKLIEGAVLEIPQGNQIELGEREKK